MILLNQIQDSLTNYFLKEQRQLQLLQKDIKELYLFRWGGDLRGLQYLLIFILIRLLFLYVLGFMKQRHLPFLDLLREEGEGFSEKWRKNVSVSWFRNFGTP